MAEGIQSFLLEGDLQLTAQHDRASYSDLTALGGVKVRMLFVRNATTCSGSLLRPSESEMTQ